MHASARCACFTRCCMLIDSRMYPGVPAAQSSLAWAHSLQMHGQTTHAQALQAGECLNDMVYQGRDTDQGHTKLHHGVGDLAAPQRRQALPQSASRTTHLQPRTPDTQSKVMCKNPGDSHMQCLTCHKHISNTQAGQVLTRRRPPCWMNLGMPSMSPFAKPGTVCTLTCMGRAHRSFTTTTQHAQHQRNGDE